MKKQKKIQTATGEDVANDVGNISVKLVSITPGMAVDMLRTNPDCDDLDEEKIQEFAGKMKSGLWKTNGTTIVISDDGTLLDGRLRLWAVFEAGIPVSFLVAVNVVRDN